MKRANLARAAEAERRIKEIEAALARAKNLKEAVLIVQGAAHNVQGMDNMPQRDESRLTLSRDVLEYILGQMREAELAELEGLGVEV